MNPIRLSILTNKSDRFDINMLDCFGNEHYPFSIEAKSVDSFVFSGDEGDIRYRYSMIAGTGLGSRWGFFTTETIRQKMKEFDDYQIITYDFDYSSFKDVDLMRNGMYNYFIQSDAKYERVEKVIGFKDNDKEVKIEVLDLLFNGIEFIGVSFFYK